MTSSQYPLADALLSSIEAGDLIAEVRGAELHFVNGTQSLGSVPVNVSGQPQVMIVDMKHVMVTSSPGTSHLWTIDCESLEDAKTIATALQSCIDAVCGQLK